VSYSLINVSAWTLSCPYKEHTLLWGKDKSRSYHNVWGSLACEYSLSGRDKAHSAISVAQDKLSALQTA